MPLMALTYPKMTSLRFALGVALMGKFEISGPVIWLQLIDTYLYVPDMNVHQGGWHHWASTFLHLHTMVSSMRLKSKRGDGMATTGTWLAR